MYYVFEFSEWHHVAQCAGEKGVIKPIATLSLVFVDHFNKVIVFKHIQDVKQTQ
jgi:hypothetical protein